MADGQIKGIKALSELDPRAAGERERPKQWMVVRKRETDPHEVWVFNRYDEAALFFDRAQAQWSDTYFCRVAHGPGYPLHDEAAIQRGLHAEAAAAPRSAAPVGDLVRAYMAESMAMPDIDSDQEQNWIAGHMVTFASKVLAGADPRSAAPEHNVKEIQK